MQTREFEAQVSHKPHVSIVHLHGEIDGFAEERLNRAYEQAANRDADVIMLDFSDVDYMNSTGIALIVTLLAQARKARRRLLAYGLSEHYIEIFQITRLADFMNVFPNEDAALQAAAHSA